MNKTAQKITKILLLQSRTGATRARLEQQSFTRLLGKWVELTSISTDKYQDICGNAPQKVFDNFSGIIMSGSAEYFLDGGLDTGTFARVHANQILHSLDPLIEYAIAQDMPMLGICFGHTQHSSTLKQRVKI